MLVKDLDATKAFYAAAFGFETIFDEELYPGFRAVHTGPGLQDGAGLLWLIRATTPEAEARVGRQTAGEPAIVLYTDDLAADLSALANLGVRPIKGPDSDASSATVAHVRDNCGNEIVLVQLPR